MISKALLTKITQKLQIQTGVNNWKITGSAIEARECAVYKSISSDYHHAIAIKIYRNIQKNTSEQQYEVLKRFSQLVNAQDNECFLPEVFGRLPEHGVILMEWIESPALERRLWRYFYSKQHVQSDISRTFKWLNSFHQLADPEKKSVDIDMYKHSLNQSIKKHDLDKSLSNNSVFQTAKKCFTKIVEHHKNFKTNHAKLHGDFTPSNILIDNNRVTAIDLFGSNLLPIENDLSLQFSYIAIEYPNMLTRSDFKLTPDQWPLLRVVLDAYDYPKDPKQLSFFLFVFLYQLLRRWTVIHYRNRSKRTPFLDRRRLRNTEMIVENLCISLENLDKQA